MTCAQYDPPEEGFHKAHSEDWPNWADGQANASSLSTEVILFGFVLLRLPFI